jgi:3-oxoacid CoA-transferase B subunit
VVTEQAGRRCLSRKGVAYRISREFRDGDIVNLGTGIPSLCADFVDPDIEVLLHAEQGLLGFGRGAATKDEVDPCLINAARQPVTPRPGMCLMDHAESFALIRGGRIDITVLGALQVSANGDLANCWIPGAAAGSLGGAQDLAFRAKRVIAALPLLRHPGRLAPRLDLVATAPACVGTVVTDIAVLELDAGTAVVTELLAGWSTADVQRLTEVELAEPPGGPGPLSVPVERAQLWDNAPTEVPA